MPILIDVALVLCFLLTVAAGVRNGFFREIFALAGLVAGTVAGFRFTPLALAQGPGFLQSSSVVYGIVFAVILVLVLFLFTLFGRLFASAWEGKKVPGLSRFLGAGLGAVRGLILVLVLAGAMAVVSPVGSGTLAQPRVLPWLGPLLRPLAAAVLPPPATRHRVDRWQAIPFRHGPPRPVPRGQDI